MKTYATEAVDALIDNGRRGRPILDQVAVH